MDYRRTQVSRGRHRARPSRRNELAIELKGNRLQPAWLGDVDRSRVSLEGYTLGQYVLQDYLTNKTKTVH